MAAAVSLRLFAPLLLGFIAGSVLAMLCYTSLLSLLEIVDENCKQQPLISVDFDDFGSSKSWQASSTMKLGFPTFTTQPPPAVENKEIGAKTKEATISNNKKPRVNRPRFYATELGIRDKLFVAVLSSRSTLHNMAIAINKTLSHHVSKVVFFVEGSHAESLPGPINLMGLANIPEHLRAIYMFEYIAKHVLANYDWFLLMPDTVYVKGFKLYELVSHMSVGYNIVMGRPYNSPPFKELCRFDAGILLSAELVQMVAANQNRCLNEADPNQLPGFNLEMCIRKVGNVPCQEEWNVNNGKAFKTWRLNSTVSDPVLLPQMVDAGAITVFPLRSTTQLYQLHEHFCRKEVEQIQGLAELVKDSVRKVSSMVPEERSWPFGTAGQWTPRNRYEFNQWEFFDQEELIDNTYERNLEKRDLKNEEDVQLVTKQALDYLATTSPDQRCSKVLNGYRRFDPTRGMDYVLDVDCAQIHNMPAANCGSCEDHFVRRIRVLRPLSRVEIVPVPHVTEASEVSLILVIKLDELVLADAFLVRKMLSCLRSSENLNFVLVILYSSASTTQLANSRQLLSKLRNSRTDFLKQLNNKNSEATAKCKLDMLNLQMERSLPVPIVSTVVQQFGSDRLYLFGIPLMDLQPEFLNRVRMNTIREFQVFFPVPFSQFNPSIVYNGAQPPPTFEVHKDAGHFDMHSFDVCSFYGSDFEQSKRKMALEKLGAILSMDLVNFFLTTRNNGSSHNLHIMRAVEPALKLRYDRRPCDHELPETAYSRCLISQKEGLGSKAALAKLVFQKLSMAV